MIKCPHPWMHQMVATDNHQTPCCMRIIEDDKRWESENYTLGINSPLYKEARAQMRKGEWPNICGVCKRAEDKNIMSYRQRAIKKYQHGHISLTTEGLEYATEIDYTEPDENLYIKSLDIKYTTKCNLACRMCSAWNSSEIEKEIRDWEVRPDFMKKLPPIDFPWESEGRKKAEYTKHLIKNGLEYYKVTGGEPFACKFFMEIIQWCVKNNYAKNITIFFTTNATKFNKKVMDLLSEFKAVAVIFSIDGTEKTYDYIRHKSSWDKLNKSIETYQKYRNNNPKVFGSPSVSCLLQAYNIFNLGDLSDWCLDNKFYFNVDANINPADHSFCAGFLPKYLTEEALMEIKLLNLPGSQVNMFKPTVDVLTNSKENIDKNMELLHDTLLFDEKRNESYRDYLDFRLVKFLDDLRSR